MKEYAFIIIMLAVMITVAAVSAGAIVYLRARYGSASLTFQLSRIGIIWLALIVLLLLGGFYTITVTGWTMTGIGDALGLTLVWARNNRIMASILLWSGSILVLLYLTYQEVCTVSVTIIVCTLHTWATYLIWQHPAWPLIKAIILAIIIICIADETGFQELSDRATRKRSDAEESPAESEESSSRPNAVEVLGDMIAECADTLSRGDAE